MTTGEKPVARKSNSDLQEYLLCDDCEGHLSRAYEDYGTNLLIDKKNIEDGSHVVVLTNFEYQRFLLFVTSIVWRASVSSLRDYAAYAPLQDVGYLLRQCILNNTLKAHPELGLDDLLKVSLIRIVDRTGQLEQVAIDSALIPLSHEVDRTAATFYYMADGYLITLTIPVAETVQQAKDTRVAGQLKDRRFIKVPKVCFTTLTQVFEAFSAPFYAENKFKP